MVVLPMQKDQRKVTNVERTFRRVAFLFFVCVLFTIGFGSSVTISVARADVTDAGQLVQDTTEAAGINASATDLPKLIGRIIYVALSLLGIVLLGYLLYGGYTYTTSRGDPKKVQEAQDIIRNAVIGIMIIAASFAITAYILKMMNNVFGDGSSELKIIKKDFTQPPGAGALGHGIEYHLPARDATGVPRNTPIIITFTDAIDPGSLIKGWTPQTSSTVLMNTDNIQIYPSGMDPIKDGLASAGAVSTFTYDHHTFVFRPVKYLGDANKNVNYTVHLNGGNSGIQLEKGGAALPSDDFKIGYTWGFQTSTVLDLTPPVISSVFPVKDTVNPRNTVIQINFNEAIDPTGASGIYDGAQGFQNIGTFAGESPTPLAGEYKISNKYQTVEFVTNDKCGVNTCGKDMFCLPVNAAIKVKIHAAQLGENPPQAKFMNNGYNGVTDVVGNSLNGNGIKGAEGPPDDDYSWNFSTSAEIKISAPIVESTTPVSYPDDAQSNRPLNELVTATFDSILRASTITSKNVKLEAKGWKEKPDTFWFYPSMNVLDDQGKPIINDKIPVNGQVAISHRAYIPSGGGLDENDYYNPFLMSDIQDVYQNCFFPSSFHSKLNPGKKCDGNRNCCNNISQNTACSFPAPKFKP